MLSLTNRALRTVRSVLPRLRRAQDPGRRSPYEFGRGLRACRLVADLHTASKFVLEAFVHTVSCQADPSTGISGRAPRCCGSVVTALLKDWPDKRRSDEALAAGSIMEPKEVADAVDSTSTLAEERANPRPPHPAHPRSIFELPSADFPHQGSPCRDRPTAHQADQCRMQWKEEINQPTRLTHAPVS